MVIRSNEIRFMFKLKVDITIRLASKGIHVWRSKCHVLPIL